MIRTLFIVSHPYQIGTKASGKYSIPNRPSLNTTETTSNTASFPIPCSPIKCRAAQMIFRCFLIPTLRKGSAAWG